MRDEEEIPLKKHMGFTPAVLDRLNVDDLHLYIAALRDEISRAEAAIAAKQGARGHAESFFKF